MKYLLSLTLLLSSSIILAKPAEDQFELILTTLNQCYEKENKIGTDLAKCFLAKVETVKNPEEYKVNVIDKNPSKTIAHPMTVTIYNKYGQIFTCNAIAQEKITFQNCTGKKIPNLTPGQELSITPP